MSAPALDSVPLTGLRADLCVTTALGRHLPPDLLDTVHRLADELHAPILPRRGEAMSKLFDTNPAIQRALVVQSGRLLLVGRGGEEFFYHPNTGFLRLGNVLRGGRDLLLDAADLKRGESVLDATLGYAGEAILCSHSVGESGEVHGIEAVPELGIIVREGLKTVETFQSLVNEAMRRIKVVHIGHHLDFLRSCPDRRYDVVCFDPFFDEILLNSETFNSLRTFGEHAPLLAEALREARRVARRRVIVKAVRWSDTLENLGIDEAVSSRSSKVAYGVLRAY